MPPSGSEEEDPYAPLPRAAAGSLVDAASWRAAAAVRAGDLYDLSFDLGRLTERVAAAGAGAVRRLALAEASSLSWWLGDRVTLSALPMLDRIANWRERAFVGTADLSGRTPAQLISALAAHPTLAAQQAEAETESSRAAVQRNLDILTQRGLVRELTGQGRFRVWAATM